ncbi:MAG: GldG family protein [Proteobacteria bacterium]|nr:GldG family protein [Pseudomonadota bacterium]
MKDILSYIASFRILAAIFGVIAYIFAVLVQFFLPELTESVFGLLILGSALLLFFILCSLREIKEFLIGKQGRYGINSTVMVIIFFGIVLLANYIGLLKHGRSDMTASGKFTLAPQTVNVIKNLKAPVEAIGFFPDGAQYRSGKNHARYLLEEYHFFNPEFKYRFVDPETKPAIARQYRVKSAGTIVFVSGSKQKTIIRIVEQEFTSALLEVTGIEAKKVYFLTGHGERDLRDTSEKGFSVVRIGLIRDLYKVETLNLTRERVVPEDCAVLVVAGASKSFPREEAEAIRDYLRNFGKVLFLIDPNPPEEIRQVLAEWGLSMAKGHVMDRVAYAVPDKKTPAIFRGNYPPMIIANGLDTTYFPEASSIVLTDELSRVLAAERQGRENEPAWPLATAQHQNLVILPALLTTKESWMEIGKKKTENAEQEKASEVEKVEGPLVLGAMLVASASLTGESFRKNPDEKLTRLVIIGDSDFASNSHIQNGGNGDLLLNSVNWLAEEEHLIDIRPKQYSFRRLLVSENASRFIRFSSVGLLPMLILVLGGIMWWRNR